MKLRERLLVGTALSVLAMGTPALAQPPSMPVNNWTGFYAGANVGYSWGNADVSFVDPGFQNGPTSFPGSMALDGAVGGGQFGYNSQNGAWVFGVETDLQASGERRGRFFSTDCEGPFGTTACNINQTAKIEWFGTTRARVGWLYTPTVMVYVTGGLAYGRITTSITASGGPGLPNCGTCSWSSSSGVTNAGGAVGGGIEGMIPGTTNLTWGVQYLYIDLGTVSGIGFDPAFLSQYTYSAKVTDNIVTFRLNYLFH